MSVYVFRNEASEGAKELALTLGGRKIRFSERHGGLYFKRGEQRIPVQLRNNDVLVCWGEAKPAGIPRNARVLNGAAIRNKFSDAQVLRQAGVPTVEVSQTLPRVAPAPPPQPLVDPAQAVWDEIQEQLEDFRGLHFGRTQPTIRGVADFTGKLQELTRVLNVPAPRPIVVAAPPQGEWLPRMNNHVGGNDLLQRPRNPDFYSKKIELVREFRIHSFQGRSIRAGQKIQRENFPNPSAWIRSWDAGWQISYANVTSRGNHRELAHQACTALGLDFGAVDIGEMANGNLVVLEVNRAPGLSDGTVQRYSGAILQFTNGEAE